MTEPVNTLPANWKIIVADSELSDSQVSFEPQGTTAMIPYRVPHADIDNVPRYFIGYATTGIDDVTTNKVLLRTLPQPHPFWDGLWGSRVNVRGEVSAAGFPDFHGVKTGMGDYDRYDEYRVEVYYATRPYDVRPDVGQTDGVTIEHQRFVEKLPSEPFYEIQSVEKGSLVFVGTSPSVVLANAVPIRVNRERIRWVWYQVPIEWALDTNNQAPHISARLNRVNSTDWCGYPQETLRLETAKIEYESAAGSLLDLGLPWWSPPRYCRITFDFVYFELGWNNLPLPGTGNWQRVKFVNTAETLYALTDFDELFDSVPLV